MIRGVQVQLEVWVLKQVGMATGCCSHPLYQAECYALQGMH